MHRIAFSTHSFLHYNKLPTNSSATDVPGRFDAQSNRGDGSEVEAAKPIFLQTRAEEDWLGFQILNASKGAVFNSSGLVGFLSSPIRAYIAVVVCKDISPFANMYLSRR
jgi:hypothetical protein